MYTQIEIHGKLYDIDVLFLAMLYVNCTYDEALKRLEWKGRQ